VYACLVNRYRISELARRTGLSASAIRYYEKVGLLPEAERTSAGYRLYGEEAEQRLVFVCRAKRLGLSLEEIAELLTFWSDGSCSATREHLQRLMVDKLEEVHREIEELADFGAQLEDAHERLAGHAPYERCNPHCGCPPDIRNDEKPTRYGSVRHRLRSLGGCE
jgi:DNA-binding transcriptional MerR regulator